MALFLGVDGGGSKTQAVVVGEAFEVLGLGEAGPSNYHYVGEATAVENVRLAASAALTMSGATAVESAAFCLAGIRRQPDFDRMEPRLAALALSPRTVLDHDAAAAHFAALAGEPGVVVIAGTGSFAFGIGREGQRFTSGGWGPTLGDEGSAYWMVLEAVKLALAAHDRGDEPGAMTQALITGFEAHDVLTLVDRVYHSGKSREEIAALAVSIGQLSEAGDRHAARVLHDAGKHLAKLAIQVSSRVYPHGDMPVISYQGNVFNAGESLRSSFRMWTRFSRPFARIFPPMHEPVFGAARLAMDPSRQQLFAPEPPVPSDLA